MKCSYLVSSVFQVLEMTIHELNDAENQTKARHFEDKFVQAEQNVSDLKSEIDKLIEENNQLMACNQKVKINRTFVKGLDSLKNE